MPAAPAPSDRWWLDAHLDVAYLHLQGPPVTEEIPDPAARGVSLASLARGRVRVFLGTIFTELGAEAAGTPWGYRDSGDADGAHAAGVRQLEVYEALERDGRVRIVRTAEDLDACAGGEAAGPPGVVLLMECADPIRTPEEVPWWHARGVRAVGLAWARGSRYAGGNSTLGPLTAAGRDCVQALDACGILHDASHLSDEAFDGLCAATSAPVVATHSNARRHAADVQRHLTDAQIREVARRGGCIGLNLFGRFLADGRAATVADAVRHVEHVASIAGRGHAGLGSDFDGGFAPGDCAAGCGRPEELPALEAALGEAGWGDADLAGFRHGNWLRTLRGSLSRSSSGR